MSSRVKNSLYIFAFAAFASVLAYLVVDKATDYLQQEDVQSGDVLLNHREGALSGWKAFQNASFEFMYPESLALTETNGKVTLNHSIPFKNTGKCDMAGENRTYDTLDDFTATIELRNAPLKAAVKSLSPYLPAENFTADGLKVTPGFIDAFTIKGLSGYMIYEGAEGCGHTVYYFPAGSDRTLVVKKDMVQQLSGILSSNIAEEILKVPGAISREKSEEIFQGILSTLKVRK